MSRSGLLVAACTLMVACSSSAKRPGPIPPPSPDGPSPSAVAFLDAWQHGLTSSWSVQETVERTTRAGQHITFPERRAQRPPTHVNTGLGSVDARFGDRLVTCSVDPANQLQCAMAGLGVPYDRLVAEQMALLRRYVSGPAAIYGVARLGSCFELQLRLAFPSPPYGRMAMFCFDPASGAPAGTVIARDEGTDRTVVVEAHSPALEADLTLPTADQMTAIARLVPKPKPPIPSPTSAPRATIKPTG